MKMVELFASESVPIHQNSFHLTRISLKHPGDKIKTRGF